MNMNVVYVIESFDVSYEWGRLKTKYLFGPIACML